MFGTTKELQGLESEIRNDLFEPPKPKETDVLLFWTNKREKYPSLSKMARSYLAIPATSFPSERVFEKGRRIVSWQRGKLTPTKVELLICMEHRIQSLGGLDVSFEALNIAHTPNNFEEEN